MFREGCVGSLQSPQITNRQGERERERGIIGSVIHASGRFFGVFVRAPLIFRLPRSGLALVMWVGLSVT